MNTAIICGGSIDYEFAAAFIEKHEIDCIIAADKGLQFCYEKKVFPNHILGDYDSIRPEILEWYRSQSDVPVTTYPAEKDDTDTAIALAKALEIGSDRIYLLGALGGRMDHAVTNIQILKNVLEYVSADECKKSVKGYIVDPQNLICLIDKETNLKREEQFGKYVSLLPFTDTVEGITLEGFKYPLNGYTMIKGESIGVSNEIVAEEAKITLLRGILLMIQSKD